MSNQIVQIRAAQLVDGISTSAKTEQAILVTNGRIDAVGHQEEIAKQTPPGAQMIDLGDAWLVPGLIDGHTHLSLAGDGRSYVQMFSETDEMMVLTGAMNLQRHLAAGITTIREHGARNKVGFTLKDGLERGYIPGPRALVSGRPITCTGGHFHMCNETADGEAEMRRSVRRLVHEGADYIKIMASGGGTVGTIPGRASYSVAELHAAVHEAHHFHRLTVAHCRAKESMVRAVEAGIDLMEHAEFLDPDGELRFDPKIAEMMAESGIWISPTLQAWTGYPRIVELRAKRDSDTISADEMTELQRLEARAEGRLDVMRRMLDYDLRDRIVPGTDSGVGNLAFGHLDYDLQLLVEVGFTPAEALISATRISAEAIGMADEIGTIAPGKIADLVAFEGDPTDDVSAFSRVIAVFQAGQRVK
ncbi:amidohydrolase family protein [Candidatus Poribacteria bacterium]|nr:amidohydrolase family protein [Candidatus Poribacteria bacterium]MYG07476.1 amidohydrolase family protein [Candidatus Poribacteria bacterium]MYK23547.1 amidohydrolase family protein [Candidatus Poribacteria bacterium]